MWLIICIITQPSIYEVIVYFFAMSGVTELLHWSINLTIDRHYTMVRLLTSLLKTHRHLSTCATMMRVRFVYERRRYARMVKIRHGLTTFNSNNSVVYGQKHKVWVLVFLVRTSRTFWDQNWVDLVKFTVLQQNRFVYSNPMQETLLSISSNGVTMQNRWNNRISDGCVYAQIRKGLGMHLVTYLNHDTVPFLLIVPMKGRFVWDGIHCVYIYQRLHDFLIFLEYLGNLVQFSIYKGWNFPFLLGDILNIQLKGSI